MFNEKFHQLLQSCFGQTEKDKSRTVLLTSAGFKAVESLLTPFLKSLPPTARVFHTKAPKYQTPFYPLMDWIRQELRENKQRASILDNAGIYPLHKPLFAAEMKGQVPLRSEEIIPEELGYERSQMFKGVGKLFQECFLNQTLVLILEDFNHYAVGTMEALLSLLKNLKGLSVLTILTVDERKVVENPHAIEVWQKFRTQMGEEMIHLNLNASDGVMTWSREETRPSHQTIQRLQNFLCLEDCVFLDETYSLRPQEVDNFEEEAMALCLGYVYFLLGDYSTAVLLYRNLLKWERDKGKVASIILIYRRLGYLSFLRNNLPEAKKWASQALKLAQNAQAEEELFYSLFLILILDSREPFMAIPEWEKLLSQLIELGETQNKPNSLAYRLSKPDRFNPVDHARQIDQHISRAIRVVSKLGNELRLANAYHILGYSKLYLGRFDEVLPLYKKSENLRKRIGNPLELSYLYNGTGYFLHQLGDFKGAFSYLQKSVQNALSAGDYHEICMGLCNIAINDLYSFQYAQAAFYLEKVIQIMNILGIKNLSFHSFREVLLLYGVSMFFSGHPDRAYEKYSMIVAMELPQTDRSKTSTEQDEILITALFQALMKIHEGDNLDGLKIMEEEMKLLQDHEKIIAYRIPFMALVLGEQYVKQQRLEDAHKLWTQARTLAQSKNYRFYEAQLLHKLEGTAPPSAVGIKHRVLDFERILESAKSSMDLQKLHKVVEKIDILNAFRQTLDSDTPEEEQICKSLGIINTAFPSDVLIFSYYRDDHWVTFQENASPQVTWKLDRDFEGLQDTLWKTHSQMSQEQKPFAKALNFLPFQTYIHVPVGNGSKKEAHLFLANQQLTTYGQMEDLKVLELAAFQLSSVVEKRWKDKQLILTTQALQNLAVTDPLTGLYNRGALMARLNEEKERALRYGKKYGISFSIVFIDLDNFKIYNDTYGHKIGDLFLQAFAELIQNSLRNVDFPCRYGGDEFVLILPETSSEGTMPVASRIIGGVKNFEVFSKILKDHNEDPSRVPQGKRLGCSMGISEYPKDIETDVNLLLQLADRALYQAKNGGKNQAMIYRAPASGQLI